MLQYNGVVSSSQRQYKGMFDALMKIYKYEGVRGLYKVRIYYLFWITENCHFHCLCGFSSELPNISPKKKQNLGKKQFVKIED